MTLLLRIVPLQSSYQSGVGVRYRPLAFSLWLELSPPLGHVQAGTPT